VLYRSSSPINNELGRASYTDNLIKDAKVNTVINLADSAENIKTYLAAKDFASPYYAELYKNNRVLCLNMGLAYTSPEFKASIVKGLVFMAENKGPYLFHCTEGKDRTGFFAALVESLMGASKDEIVEDYMQSYINYYGVQKGTDKYKVISEDVLAMLKFIAGTADLDKADLATAARKYLLSGGMTAGQIETLKANLAAK
jgi:protein tyrosine/serine phosphatase